MGRLVDPKPRVAVARATGDNGAKDYLERLAKYIPAEMLAAYLTLLPIVASTTDGQPTMRLALQLVVFIAFVALTPLYLRFMATKGQPKRLHMIVGTGAFVVWAYYQGALFATLGWYHAGLAAVVLVIYTLVSAVLVPNEGDA